MNKVQLTVEEASSTYQLATDNCGLKKGYKQTEVGVIPEDWSVQNIGGIARVMGGGAFKSRDSSSTGIRWLKIANVGVNEIVWNEENYLPKQFEITSRDFLLKEGDYVLALTRPILSGVLKISRIRKQDTPSLLNQRVGKIQSIYDHDQDFLYFLFQKESTIIAMQQSMAGTDPPNLSTKGIYSILCAVPKESTEQRAIATALSDVDALLAKLDQLITKKRDLKQATMQQLLTGQTRLPGFSGEWKEQQLGSVITHCFSGATPYRGHPEFYNGDIRWITSGELNYNVITDTKEKITKDAVIRTNLKILPKGTFLMAITGLEAEGTRGSCGIVGASSTTNQSCMAIFPTDDLLTEYLFHYYVYRGKLLALQYCQGTKQQSYTAKLVKLLPIALPPTVYEQRAIATILSDMDAEITALETRRDKTRDLKQGMMQELLTGKIRLI